MAEQAVDRIAELISDLAVLVGDRSGGRGDELAAVTLRLFSNPRSLLIVGPVGDQAFGWDGSRQERQRHADVAYVARHRGERYRWAMIIGRAMGSDHDATARATDGLAPRPLYGCPAPHVAALLGVSGR